MTVASLDADGWGTSSLAGVECVLSGVIPGERVEVELPPGRGRARVLRVLEPSPQRVTPRCRHVAECGGCTWQHIAYPEQLRLKRDRLQRGLDAALGRAGVKVGPVLGMPGDAPGEAPWGFRHKVHFALDEAPGGRLVMGHVQAGSRRVFDAAECPVHASRGNAVAFAVKDALQRARIPAGPPPRGVARHVVSRVGHASGEVVTTLVVTENVAPLKRVTREVLERARPDGWHLNLHPKPNSLLYGPTTRHLSGRARVREEVGGVTFLVSPTSFFQTNVVAAAMLCDAVRAAVPDDGGRVLDLYAGLGFFSLALARRGHPVVAVEENPSAVEDGEASARFNGIAAPQCRFVRARTEDALDRLANDRGGFDTVVMDPPREGASDAVLRALRHGVRPRRIVYVSCFPDALARDLARLTRPTRDEATYRLVGVTPLDMFPHTAHVEAVAILDRRDA